MSARNSLTAKADRRRRKLFRATPPGYTDLIQWVKTREHVSTGKAVKVILTGCLKSDSHILGRDQHGQFQRYVPSAVADRIMVVTPDFMRDE